MFLVADIYMKNFSPRASNKRARRRHRFRRSHKVDITSGEPQKELDESMNVKLNNYMSLASPKNSVSVSYSLQHIFISFCISP